MFKPHRSHLSTILFLYKAACLYNWHSIGKHVYCKLTDLGHMHLSVFVKLVLYWHYYIFTVAELLELDYYGMAFAKYCKKQSPDYVSKVKIYWVVDLRNCDCTCLGNTTTIKNCSIMHVLTSKQYANVRNN